MLAPPDHTMAARSSKKRSGERRHDIRCQSIPERNDALTCHNPQVDVQLRVMH